MRTSRARSVLVAVAVALVAAACGGDGSSSGSAGTAQGPGGGVDAGTPAVGEFEPGEGGTFRYAANLGVPNWDPASEARGFAPTYFNVVYDGLLLERSDGSLEPGLATDWEQSDDAVTFTLREGVAFHDGSPFDAEAVAYNIDRVKQQANANSELLSSVAEVEVASAREVVLRLSERDPDLLNALARMPGMMVSPAVAPEDVAAGVPAGTGPYRVVDFAEDRTVLERNPDYWDPTQQYLDRIEFMVLGDNDARLNALLTGQADAALLVPAQVATAEAAGFSIDETPSNVGFLNVVDVGGASVPALADVRVRQALAHAVDREAWSAAVVQGVGEPTSQFFGPDTPWFVEGWEGYEYDPERARELLADAGVESIELEAHTWGAFVVAYQVLQQMFDDIGVDMTINQVAPGSDTAAIAEGRVAVSFTFMSANHPETMWGQYFDADLPRNAWGEVAPGADDARAALAAAPTDELDAAYRDLLRVMYEEAWGIPIWVNHNIIGFDAERFPTVHGIDNVVLGVALRELGPAA